MRQRTTNPLETYPGRRIHDALGRYGYLTGQQATRLLYDEDSEKFVMAHLKRLKDAGLANNDNFLPKTKPGPGGTKTLWSREKGRKSPQFVEHLVLVNDCLIAFERWARETERIELLTLLHDREMKKNPVWVELGGNTVSVVPDGFVSLRTPQGPTGIVLEADRGSEAYNDPHQSTTWKGKVERLVELERTRLEDYFGVGGGVAAVVVRTPDPNKSYDRMKSLVRWTEDALANKQAWGVFFLFTAIDPAEVSAEEFVQGYHWIQPFTHSSMPLMAS